MADRRRINTRNKAATNNTRVQRDLSLGEIVLERSQAATAAAHASPGSTIGTVETDEEIKQRTLLLQASTNRETEETGQAATRTDGRPGTNSDPPMGIRTIASSIHSQATRTEDRPQVDAPKIRTIPRSVNPSDYVSGEGETIDLRELVARRSCAVDYIQAITDIDMAENETSSSTHPPVEMPQDPHPVVRGKNTLPPGSVRPGAFSNGGATDRRYQSIEPARLHVLAAISTQDEIVLPTLVVEEDEDEIALPTVIVEDEPGVISEVRGKRKMSPTAMAGLVILVVILIIMAIVVPLIVVGGARNDNSPIAEPQPQPSSKIALADVFPEGELPMATREAILTEKEQLPQVQAYQWLVQDENWPKYSTAHLRQRFALASIYYATNGPHWFDHLNGTDEVPTNTWLDYSTHECEWYSSAPNSAICYNYSSYPANPWDYYADYQSLLLSRDPSQDTTQVQAGLKGTLVPEVALLTSLESLDLGFQDIKGTIPTQLAQLSLDTVSLSGCHFSGTIPLQLFEFPRHLSLSGNSRLDSSIPTAIGKNSLLTHLFLQRANIHGTLPNELGLATQLQELHLDGNNIAGSVPTELGQLKSLGVLDLRTNLLTGVIPRELGQAVALSSLRLGENTGITGTLPRSLGQLSNLELLDIYLTSLEGALSPELFFVLETSNSGSNKSTDSSVITPSWPRIRTLFLSKNQLTGTLPTELGILTKLTELALAANKFTGTVPKEIGRLTNLSYLNLNVNQFIGTLPSTIGSLTALTYLDFGMIQSTGTLPTELGLLTALAELFLNGNQFTGTIPTVLGTLSVLKYLSLEFNRFVGTIPSSVCSLSALTTLEVDCRELACSCLPCLCA